jgi:hypothetical protein
MFSLFTMHAHCGCDSRTRNYQLIIIVNLCTALTIFISKEWNLYSRLIKEKHITHSAVEHCVKHDLAPCVLDNYLEFLDNYLSFVVVSQ